MKNYAIIGGVVCCTLLISTGAWAGPTMERATAGSNAATSTCYLQGSPPFKQVGNIGIFKLTGLASSTSPLVLQQWTRDMPDTTTTPCCLGPNSPLSTSEKIAVTGSSFATWASHVATWCPTKVTQISCLTDKTSITPGSGEIIRLTRYDPYKVTLDSNYGLGCATYSRPEFTRCDGGKWSNQGTVPGTYVCTKSP